MYLYTIPKQLNKSEILLTNRKTKLKKYKKLKRQKKNINKTKKIRRKELTGGLFGIDFCKLTRCHMSKTIYKNIKDLMLPHILSAFNITKDASYKEKFEYIVEQFIDSGLLRQFLHGVNYKMGTNRKYLESTTHKYLDYIKIFIKLLVLSASPDKFAYSFPTSYQKYNSDGRLVDENGTVRNQEINIPRNVISADILINIIDNILKADKENLLVDILKNRYPTFAQTNTFIFDESINTVSKKLEYDYVNTVLYFYSPSSCSINESGHTQQQDNCRAVFTFNTKTTSLSDKELTRDDFVCVETNFKEVRAYVSLLKNSSDKAKNKIYKLKIIKLLKDSNMIKRYVDGCIKFFIFMEKYKSSSEPPNLYYKYILSE